MKRILVSVFIDVYLFPDVEQDLRNFIQELQEVYDNNIGEFEHLEFKDEAPMGYVSSYALYGFRFENDKEFEERCEKLEKEEMKKEKIKKRIEKEEYKNYLTLKEKYGK